MVALAILLAVAVATAAAAAAAAAASVTPDVAVFVQPGDVARLGSALAAADKLELLASVVDAVATQSYTGQITLVVREPEQYGVAPHDANVRGELEQRMRDAMPSAAARRVLKFSAAGVLGGSARPSPIVMLWQATAAYAPTRVAAQVAALTAVARSGACAASTVVTASVAPLASVARVAPGDGAFAPHVSRATAHAVAAAAANNSSAAPRRTHDGDTVRATLALNISAAAAADHEKAVMQVLQHVFAAVAPGAAHPLEAMRTEALCVRSAKGVEWARVVVVPPAPAAEHGAGGGGAPAWLVEQAAAVAQALGGAVTKGVAALARHVARDTSRLLAGRADEHGGMDEAETMMGGSGDMAPPPPRKQHAAARYHYGPAKLRARADTFKIDADARLDAGDILGNDEGGVGGRALVRVRADSVSGVLLVNADWTSVYYEPPVEAKRLAVGETITEHFRYTVRDCAGAEAHTSVTIEVCGVNDPPTALDDTISVSAQPRAAGGTDVLANDFDIDDGDAAPLRVLYLNGDRLAIGRAHRLPLPFEASVLLEASGGATYTLPDTLDFALVALPEGAVARDRFVYGAVDEHGGVGLASVNVEIVGVNDAPHCPPALDFYAPCGALTTVASTPDLLGSCFDPDTGETAGLFLVEPSGDGARVSIDAADVTFDARALSVATTDSVELLVSDAHGATTALELRFHASALCDDGRRRDAGGYGGGYGGSGGGGGDSKARALATGRGGGGALRVFCDERVLLDVLSDDAAVYEGERDELHVSGSPVPIENHTTAVGVPQRNVLPTVGAGAISVSIDAAAEFTDSLVSYELSDALGNTTPAGALVANCVTGANSFPGGSGEAPLCPEAGRITLARTFVAEPPFELGFANEDDDLACGRTEFRLDFDTSANALPQPPSNNATLGDAVLRVVAQGDFDASDEVLLAYINGEFAFELLNETSGDEVSECSLSRAERPLSAKQLEDVLSGRELVFIAGPGVNRVCGQTGTETFVTVEISYNCDDYYST